MPDYAKVAATAQRLIEKSGRPITLVKLSATPTDPTKPWRAPTARTGAEEVQALGVFVPLASSTFLGIADTLPLDVKRGEQICLVAGATSDSDLATFTEIIDEGETRWKIVRPQTLKPGSLTLVYAFEVKR